MRPLQRYYATTWQWPSGERCYAIRDRSRSGAHEIYKWAYTARQRRDLLNEQQGKYHEQ